MNDTLPNTNPCASGCDGKAIQSLCMVGQQTVCRAGQVRACGYAAATDKGNEKVNAATYLWYALTVPFRLFVVFACAVILVTGICVLSVFGGDR